MSSRHPAQSAGANSRPARPSALDGYEDLVADALAAVDAMNGWNFDYLRSRTSGGDLSWSYGDMARQAISAATRVLDVDTGGGELLASLRPLPAHTVAIEEWEPNLPVARERLEALGVEVRQIVDGQFPVGDGEFDLILNRHGRTDVDEVSRALAPGGLYLTQQVGNRNDVELCNALGATPPDVPGIGTLATSAADLRAHGLQILDQREDLVAYRFHDIAAVVFQLSVVSWTIPDFDLNRYGKKLRELDSSLRTEGPLVTHNHRYLIKAVKPRPLVTGP